MSRWARLILLVSLGLNLGLGWALFRTMRTEEPRSPLTGRAWRARPAPEDTAAWHRMMQHRVERLSSLLELEPEQAAQLQRLQKANAPLVRAQRERIGIARQQVRTVADAGSPDGTGVRGALAGLRRAQAELDSLTQEFLMQELALMTPPQRARYLELLPLDPWRSSRSVGPDGPGGHDGDPRRSGNRRHRQE